MKNKLIAGMSKIAIATVLSTAMAATPVFAATGDLWNGSQDVGNVGQLILQPTKFLDLVAHMSNYKYEINGNLYDATAANNVFLSNPNAALADVQSKIASSVTGTPVPTQQALAVASVSAINVKQVKVTFNQAVDSVSAQTGANYTLSGGTLLADPNGAVLQPDGKTVILNVSGAGMANFTQETLTVANVKDSNGKVMTTSSTNFTPQDQAVPTVTSITSLGNQNVNITFSEPTQNCETFTGSTFNNIVLDGTALTTSQASATYSLDHTQLTLAFTGGLSQGPHTIAIKQNGTANDAASYAGYKVPSVSQTVTINAGTTAPSVAGITANSQTSVTVKFSEPVNINTSADLAHFYWNTSNSASDNSKTADSITQVDSQTYTISFTGTNKPLTAGTDYFFVTGVADFSGNLLAGNVAANTYGQSVTVTANAQPSLTSVTDKDTTHVEVYFSASMDSSTAQNAGNYVVTDSKGNTVTVSNAAFVANTNQKQIELTTSAMTSGSYTVAINNVKDVVGNTLSAQPASITVVDTSAPAVSTFGFEGQSVVINFNRAMSVSGTYSVLNTAAYQYKTAAGTRGALPSGSTIVPFNGNQSVRITLPSTTVPATGDTIYVGGISGTTLNTVADAAGNLYVPDSGSVLTTAATAIDISAGTPSLKVVNSSTLKLVEATGNAFGTVSPSDFQVTADGSTWVTPSAVTIDSTDTTSHTLLFTFPSNVTLTAGSTTTAGVRTVTTVSSSTTDIYGTKLASSKTVAGTASSAIAPVLSGATLVSPTEVDATFSETMASQIGGALENSIQIVQGSKVLTGYSATPVQGAIKGSVASGVNAIAFTLNAADALDPSQPVTVRTVSADYMQAKDTNGNLLAANTTGVTVSTFAPVSVALSTTSQLKATDTFTVTYNKNVDPTSIISGWDGSTPKTGLTMSFNSDGSATVGGTNLGTFKGLTVLNTGTATVQVSMPTTTSVVVTVTTVNGSTNVTENGTLTYVPSTGIKSLAGNSISSTNATVAVDDSPYVASVSLVNGTGTVGTAEAGDKIVITYSEPVSIAGLTPGAAAIASTTTLGDTTTAGTIAGVGSFATPGGVTVATGGNTVALSADGKTLTITLGTFTGTTVAPSGVFTPVAGPTDKEGSSKALILTITPTATGAF
ncbi:hypothetical protein [Desulfosporosinus sp. FKA]|uniref:beta strand repeat-containing protein n=1 Tax=Desulfosporosinus sp. FKA TaxID=1969834 RepID=UPI000B4A52B3|nr:hypothetical protein [Desulfosporosinus sp. FKA]